MSFVRTPATSGNLRSITVAGDDAPNCERLAKQIDVEGRMFCTGVTDAGQTAVGIGKTGSALTARAVPINQYREQAGRRVTFGPVHTTTGGKINAQMQARRFFETVFRADYIIIRSAICEQQNEAAPLSILD